LIIKSGGGCSGERKIKKKPRCVIRGAVKSVVIAIMNPVEIGTPERNV
jgi:hypothetical protein